MSLEGGVPFSFRTIHHQAFDHPDLRRAHPLPIGTPPAVGSRKTNDVFLVLVELVFVRHFLGGDLMAGALRVNRLAGAW